MKNSIQKDNPILNNLKNNCEIFEKIDLRELILRPETANIALNNNGVVLAKLFNQRLVSYQSLEKSMTLSFSTWVLSPLF